MKRFAFTLLAILLSIVFVLSAVEIFLRIDGRYQLYHEKNNQRYFSQYSVRTNPEHLFRLAGHDSLVFPKKEFVEKRKVNRIGFTDHRELSAIDTSSETIRILALGDSFTEGMGAEYEESWPSVMEELLNSSESSNKFIVYNAGISGCDPFFSYQNLKFLFPHIKPGIVILLMNTTDYTDVYFRGGWERFKENNQVVYSRQAPWWEYYYAKLHVARMLVDWLDYNIFLTRDPYEQAIMSTFPIIKQAVDSFRTFSTTHHSAFIPVFNPIPTYHSEQQYSQDSIFVRNFIAPDNPNFLDLTPIVRQHRYDKDYFWQYDNHCTAKGYRLFADKGCS